MKKLSKNIITWGREKGILDKSNPLAQLGKTQEEVNELFESLIAQNNDWVSFKNTKGKMVNTRAEINDAIGDIAVTLILQCEMQNVDFKDCIKGAYYIIKGRKGKMKDGVFVKEE